MKSIVYELENFHFSYNAICSKPTNRLEKIYSSFSINLRKCSDKVKAREILKDLINQLNALYVSYQEFESEFIKLSYSKRDTITNIKARYAINKIAAYFEIFIANFPFIYQFVSEISSEDSPEQSKNAAANNAEAVNATEGAFVEKLHSLSI